MGTQPENQDQTQDFGGAKCVSNANLAYLSPLPDLRSPADCYHSEAYLIGWLVKLYGWRVTEPGTIRRGWNRADAAMASRQAWSVGVFEAGAERPDDRGAA